MNEKRKKIGQREKQKKKLDLRTNCGNCQEEKSN